MINRSLVFTLTLLFCGVCVAEDKPILELAPLPDTDNGEMAPPADQKKETDKKKQQDEDDERIPYQYPQAHHFGYSVEAGGDQLNVHRGYWLPGGYEPRSGSPYFYSVPGAPPRGPLGGTVASGYTGGNPQLDQHAQGAGNFNPYNGFGYGQAAGYGYNGYSAQPYNNGGYANGAAMSGGAGGDPYQYHFGPGFYRSGEYGHFRFPFYSYRRPWYHPGFAGYNRDTNLPW